jgi:DHA3 family macrolide efflux protein-like MFS transporter
MTLPGSVPRFVRSSPYRPVVAHPVLRRVLPGLAISSVGDGMSVVAVSWLAIQLAPPASRGAWVAAALAATTLPSLLGTLTLGRFMRGRGGAQLAGWDAILRATALGAIPVCHAFGVLDGRLYVALLALSSWLRSWGNAGRYSLIAELLPQEHHLAGNAVMGLLGEIAGLVGPAIAAAAIGVGGAPLAIAVDAATFAILAMTYLFAVPRAHRAGPAKGAGERATGFATIFRSRALLALTALSFGFYLLYGPVQVALPVYAAEVPDGSAATLAAFWTAFGVGAVIGSFGAGHLKRRPIWPTTAGIVMGWGIALLPLGLGAPPLAALISFGVGGLIWAPFPSTSMALLQRSTDGPTRPQVLAANSTLVILSVPSGALVGGPLVGAIGAQPAITASAILTVSLGVAAFGCLRFGRLVKRGRIPRTVRDRLGRLGRLGRRIPVRR